MKAGKEAGDYGRQLEARARRLSKLDTLEKAGKLKRVPFEERDAMKKLADPGDGDLREGNRRRRHLRRRSTSPRSNCRSETQRARRPLLLQPAWRGGSPVRTPDALLSFCAAAPSLAPGHGGLCEIPDRVLLAFCVGILVIPVTLQIISRYTALIPSYIWTEEMARFLFIWTIMIGAMVGVREAQHFEVDVWPTLSRRSEAAVRIVARLGVLALAFVFVVGGIEFTRFAWNSTSELADLPLWLIHVAWPVGGRDLDRLRG